MTPFEWFVVGALIMYFGGVLHDQIEASTKLPKWSNSLDVWVELVGIFVCFVALINAIF